MKAMAPDPDLRYQSAAELGLDLAAFRAGGKVQAVAEDLEATRRTFRRPEVSEETRRTAGDETRRTGAAPLAVAAAAEDVEPAAPVKKPKRELHYWAARGIAGAVLACVVYAAWAGVSDYGLYRQGQALEHDIASEQITDPSQIWTRWAELSKDNPLSFFLRGPRNVAREKFVAAADHVIDTYRNNDTQPVYEADWQRAQTMLLHALSTDPDDKTKALHGKLRVTEGHIARINGAFHHSVAYLNNAVQKFQEAQQLMPQSPDPPLGLARVYVLLRDVDKATVAFHQAETNGFQLGNRERTQLADAYRERADRTWWDARTVRGLPQEKDQIQQAANDYQRALDLYQKSAGYGNATQHLAQVQTSLESVNTRLQQIALEQEQPGPVAATRGRVAGAIIGLLNALREKSTKKDGSEH